MVANILTLFFTTEQDPRSTIRWRKYTLQSAMFSHSSRAWRRRTDVQTDRQRDDFSIA